MRHIITTLLTTALVLMTSAVFSQNDICGSNELPTKESTRAGIESAYRIRARKAARIERVEKLIELEKNMTGYQKSNYSQMMDDVWDYEMCIPVVFNIIHNGAAYNTRENPSDEDILIIFDLLNEQFDGVTSGIQFTLGADGTASTAIRRFDRTDPSNEYIVYGDPNTAYDDWPPAIDCNVDNQFGAYFNNGEMPPNLDGFSTNFFTARYEYWFLRYLTRTTYDPENTLNIYLMPLDKYNSVNGIAPSFPEWDYQPGSSLNGNFGEFPEVPIKRNTGIFINTTPCSNTNYIQWDDLHPINANNSTYNDLVNYTKRLFAHEVGHYLGMWHTFTEPSDDVMIDLLYEYSNTPDGYWEGTPTPVLYGGALIFSEIDADECELHGDFCCDTKWSSSYFSPLNLSWGSSDNCSQDVEDFYYNHNELYEWSNASGTSSFLFSDNLQQQHAENEAQNRTNVMNYSWGGATSICDDYIFTDDQVTRMHDMTNYYRQDLIGLGSTLCLDPEVEPVFGCIDPIACNYYAPANTSDGSCFYDCCPECLMDFNNDGLISVFDLMQYLNVFNTVCPE